MASPERWNYWIEIHAGSRDWVDFDGNSIDRIVVSVGVPLQTIANTLILPLGVEPSSVESLVENFPSNLMQRIPDFSFTFNIGYTSPDGLFSTVDVFSALEQYNSSAGKVFNLIGCKCALVAGDASQIGMWHDSSAWRCAFSTIASSVPAPSVSENMRFYYDGIISGMNINGTDTATINTTWPDETANVGHVSKSDDEDSIDPLFFSYGINKSKVAINAGRVIIGHGASIHVYYLDPGTDRLWLVDPTSYTVEYLSGSISIYLQLSGEAYQSVYLGPITDQNLQALPNMSRISGSSLLPSATGVNRFFLSNNGLNIGDGNEIAAVSSGPVEHYLVDYLGHPRTCLRVPFLSSAYSRYLWQHHASGRAYDGSTMQYWSYETRGYPKTKVDNAGYTVVFNVNALPDGAYGASSELESSNPYIGYEVGNGIAGDLTAFNANSVYGPSVRTWDENTGLGAPIILAAQHIAEFGDYQEDYKKNVSRMKVVFPDFKNMTGTVRSLTVYADFMYSGIFIGAKSAKVVFTTKEDSLGVMKKEFTIDNGSGVQIIANLQNTYAQPFQIYGRCNASSLYEFCIDAQFEDFTIDDGELSHGVFMLYGMRIEAVIESTIKEGSSVVVDSAEMLSYGAGSVVNYVMSEFSGQIETDTKTLDNLEFEAIVNKLTPMRDVVRNVLNASGTFIKDSFSDSFSGTAIKHVSMGSITAALSATTKEIDDQYLFTDGMPVAEVQNGSLKDVYNAVKISFHYDPVLARYSKQIYVDRNGFILTGFSESTTNLSPSRCAYASTIIGNNAKVLSVELPYGTETGALALADFYTQFVCWPCKTASADIAISNPVHVEIFDKLRFTGSTYPYYMRVNTWLALGVSNSASVDDATTTLSLIEIPDWPT